MPCTTILIGRLASYDGSTMMARNEDSAAGEFNPKKFVTVRSDAQPRQYQSVLSRVEIDLPENPMGYTAMPNALPEEGIWAAAGVNEANVAMTATETITSNPRVQGADPLVKTGIGEEDFVTITLPYIRSAREGVLRLGSLLEQYGTYEKNGVGFQDRDEIWWLETIGGHHWIAKRVPDECYVVMPNQQGIDRFDLADAFGERREHLCSADLLDFIRENHLDLGLETADVPLEINTVFDARAAFGSREDADRVYNTPRAWDMLRYFNPRTYVWEGPAARFFPESTDLPWSMIPERKITPEDVKYALSAHYQGTPYDPYGSGEQRGKYRSIGVNRNNVLVLTQLRPYTAEKTMALEWVAYGSNVFNALVPFYAHVKSTPEYFANTGPTVDTASFYWANRLIGALADAQYTRCRAAIERYQERVADQTRALLARFDREAAQDLEACNQEISDLVQRETAKVLDKVLFETSCGMKNAFSRSDA